MRSDILSKGAEEMAKYPKGYKMSPEEKAEFIKRITRDGKYPLLSDMTPEQRAEMYARRSEKHWEKKEKEREEQRLGDLARRKRDKGHGAKWVGKLDKIALAENTRDGAVKASDSLKAIDTLARLTGDLSDTINVNATVGVTNWRDFIVSDEDGVDSE